MPWAIEHGLVQSDFKFLLFDTFEILSLHKRAPLVHKCDKEPAGIFPGSVNVLRKPFKEKKRMVFNKCYMWLSPAESNQIRIFLLLSIVLLNSFWMTDKKYFRICFCQLFYLQQ